MRTTPHPRHPPSSDAQMRQMALFGSAMLLTCALLLATAHQGLLAIPVVGLFFSISGLLGAYKARQSKGHGRGGRNPSSR